MIFETLDSLGTLTAAEWNALAGLDDPFMEHEFLYGMETCGLIGEHSAWIPRYLLAWRDHRLVAALPLFLKHDSFGEYIFDWAWADAYRRAGLRYYPKAVAAVPFTPVAGNRVLVHPGESRESSQHLLSALIDRALELVQTRGLSGLHVLFCTEREQRALESRDFMPRITQQFHWRNHGYGDFEDFLADLRSKKRKQIKRERAAVAELGFDIEILEGDRISSEHMSAMWDFYADTIARKWSEAYLNREFFDFLLRNMRHRLLMVMVRSGGRLIAGTLNLRKNRRLFGRYWGALEGHPGLHFECCFYRLIDYAIEHGIDVVEAGAQGEHKFLRGFAAQPIHSAHYLAHPGAKEAVAEFLRTEREHNLALIRGYNRVSPIKRLRIEA